mmetsp:Transcript_40867/g.89426  ORF Transcript_40867/g.89426 Transcript_40867/m.89426 type:complete len:301 (-) Transcript_40867:54-956(-)
MHAAIAFQCVRLARARGTIGQHTGHTTDDDAFHPRGSSPHHILLRRAPIHDPVNAEFPRSAAVILHGDLSAVDGQGAAHGPLAAARVCCGVALQRPRATHDAHRRENGSHLRSQQGLPLPLHGQLCGAEPSLLAEPAAFASEPLLALCCGHIRLKHGIALRCKRTMALQLRSARGHFGHELRLRVTQLRELCLLLSQASRRVRLMLCQAPFQVCDLLPKLSCFCCRVVSRCSCSFELLGKLAGRCAGVARRTLEGPSPEAGAHCSQFCSFLCRRHLRLRQRRLLSLNGTCLPTGHHGAST